MQTKKLHVYKIVSFVTTLNPIRVAPGLPDTRTCLLHQKLQMLNVCIEKRLQREKGIKPRAEMVVAQPEDTINITDDETDEEEFYDFTDDEDDGDDDVDTAGDTDKKLKEKESQAGRKSPTKPEGRLQRLGNLKLLDSEEYLYTPITQDLAPKTEDQLQDASDVMLKMGSDSGLFKNNTF